MSRARSVGRVALGLAAIAGCASVDVHRVRPDDYETKGFRYYLPRPYVAVRKPFVVAGDDFFVSGTIKAGNVVSIERASVPEAIRPYFGGSGSEAVQVPLTAILPPATPATPRGPHVQGAAVAAPAAAAAPSCGDASLLDGSAFDPALLSADKSSFKVTAALSKDANFTTVAGVTLMLVPFDDHGQAQISKAVTLEGMATDKAFKKGDTAGSYSATGRRSDVKSAADWTVALKFNADKLTDCTVVGAAPLLHVVGATAPAAAADTTKQTAVSDTAVSSAKIATSGDPSTSPQLKINDYFDIVMMPDFDQQYVINIQPGVGKANGAIGLENGWMMEKASVDLDNSKLGQFIFSNVEKLVDLGIDLAKVSTGPGGIASLLAEGATGSSSQGLHVQGEAPGATILLRVRYVLEAMPGLYPVLKPADGEAWKAPIFQPGAGDKDRVMVPYPPFTVVAYNVRRMVAIERVNVTSAAAAPPGEGAVAGGKQLSTDGLAALDEWLTNHKLDDVKKHRTAAALCMSDHRVAVKVDDKLSAPAVLALEAKLKAAFKPNTSARFGDCADVTGITLISVHAEGATIEPAPGTK